MTDTPSVAGIISPRSSGILMDYTVSHPCVATTQVQRRMFDQCSVLSTKPKCGDRILPTGASAPGSSPMGISYNTGGSSNYVGSFPPEDDEYYAQFDRVQDWIACFGAFIIIACTLGLVQSYAVFAPAVQHVYETGYAEASAVGCFCYSILVLFLPVAAIINRSVLKHRWTTLFGMLLIFIGLLLDAMTLGRGVLYASHLLFMGIGGSLAYGSAMSVCCDRFRKKVSIAMSVISSAGCFGTIVFYMFSNFLLEFISYMWCKLCLAMIVLICMAACQTFPPRSQYVTCPGHHTDHRSKVKECLASYDNKQKKVDNCEEEAPHKSILCVCVCDISVFSDLSFMLWAVLNLIAVSTIFIPYIGLVSASYEVGQTSALGLVAAFCICSIAARFGLIMSEDHSFRRARILFVVSCFGNGFLYAALSWVQTPGWLLIWGSFAGLMEGILCVAIPRLTIHTVPFKWLGTAWTFVVIFHGIATPLGALMHVFFYHSILNGSPAWVALAVAQFIAAILAFLLPNELGPLRDVGGISNIPSLPAPAFPSISREPFGSSNFSTTTTITSSAIPYFKSLNEMNRESVKSYTSNCPICSKIGCIPGCCPECIPGGLASSFKASSSLGYRDSGFSSSYYHNTSPFNLSGSLGSSGYSSYPRSNNFPAGCNDIIGQMNNYLASVNNNCNESSNAPRGSSAKTTKQPETSSKRKSSDPKSPSSSRKSSSADDPKNPANTKTTPDPSKVDPPKKSNLKSPDKDKNKTTSNSTSEKDKGTANKAKVETAGNATKENPTNKTGTTKK